MTTPAERTNVAIIKQMYEDLAKPQNRLSKYRGFNNMKEKHRNTYFLGFDESGRSVRIRPLHPHLIHHSLAQNDFESAEKMLLNSVLKGEALFETATKGPEKKIERFATEEVKAKLQKGQIVLKNVKTNKNVAPTEINTFSEEDFNKIRAISQKILDSQVQEVVAPATAAAKKEVAKQKLEIPVEAVAPKNAATATTKEGSTPSGTPETTLKGKTLQENMEKIEEFEADVREKDKAKEEIIEQQQKDDTVKQEELKKQEVRRDVHIDDPQETAAEAVKAPSSPEQPPHSLAAEIDALPDEEDETGPNQKQVP